jgi:hypothetical protein
MPNQPCALACKDKQEESCSDLHIPKAFAVEKPAHAEASVLP